MAAPRQNLSTCMASSTRCLAQSGENEVLPPRLASIWANSTPRRLMPQSNSTGTPSGGPGPGPVPCSLEISVHDIRKKMKTVLPCHVPPIVRDEHMPHGMGRVDEMMTRLITYRSPDGRGRRNPPAVLFPPEDP